MPTELLLLGALRAVVEIALLFLVGRGVLALLAGSRRHDNIVYRLFVLLTQPLLRGLQWLSMNSIGERQAPFVAGLLLFCLWIGLAWLKLLWREGA